MSGRFVFTSCSFTPSNFHISIHPLYREGEPRPHRWINKDMRLVTECLSTRQMAEIASEVAGKKLTDMELDEAAFEKTKDAEWPGAEDMYLNFMFFIKVLSALFEDALMIA